MKYKIVHTITHFIKDYTLSLCWKMSNRFDHKHHPHLTLITVHYYIGAEVIPG